MQTRVFLCHICYGGRKVRYWLLLLVLSSFLSQCTPGGDQDQATAPSAPSPPVEHQALANLLALYQEAVVAEDSDRPQALLAPATALAQAQTTATAPALRQDPPGVSAAPAALQETLRATLHRIIDVGPDCIHLNSGGG